MTKKTKILAVDEAFNLNNLTYYLSSDGYEVIGAEDGQGAMQKLEEHPDVEVIVLDCVTPNMSGMDVLEKVKADSRFHDIPVIMQSANASSEQVLQGIKAGIYYYLTKPYEDVLLHSIVKSALQDANNKKEMMDGVRKHKGMFGKMEQSHFRFRTLEEARNLACYIANCFPDPETAVYGLSELFINAIEHGNLGITYTEKTQLLMNNTWQQEVERRLELTENTEKFVHFSFELVDGNIKAHVKDEGAGFDWTKYLEITPDRAADPNGRGIATSRMMSFHKLEYLGCGNEVVCTVALSPQS